MEYYYRYIGIATTLIICIGILFLALLWVYILIKKLKIPAIISNFWHFYILRLTIGTGKLREFYIGGYFIKGSNRKYMFKFRLRNIRRSSI